MNYDDLLRQITPELYATFKRSLELGRWLEGHPAVAAVHHPGLESHPQFDLIQRQLTGYAGMLSFEIDGGIEAARRIVENTELFYLTESFGGVESLIQHPRTMSHSSMSEEALNDAGITDSLIRISVGLEDTNDLLTDLDRVLG